MLSAETVWILLYLTVLCALLYWSLLFSSFHAFALCTVIYVAYYLVAYAGDGCRQWPLIRQLGIWDIARPYQRIYEKWPSAGKYVFVTETRGATANWLMSIWAFALQGRHFQFQALVCLPRKVFYVPYLTDALQWTGCIGEDDALTGLEHASIVVTRDVFDREILTWINLDLPFQVVPVLHCPNNRCTLIADPLIYTERHELDSGMAQLLNLDLVNPFEIV